MQTSYILEDELGRISSNQGWLNLGELMNCTTCTAKLPKGAVFCGGCGARTSKRRDSLTGMMFDGRYHIEAKLAAGGFGSIYRATYVPTGARVALKVLHPDLASDPTLSARFRREAAVLESLRDPHTIKTYEHGEAADGTLYIAMELLTGRSLQAELRTQGPLPWWRMLAIMRGVCDSLIEAHSRGIVHRDLKPANIHLEHRGGQPDFVKVLDFGIVKMLSNSGIDDESDITRVGQAIGTLEYMAPEQIIGTSTDHRTDLYTLGVVAYEMITGRRPFAEAAGPTSLMTALMTRTPTAPSTLFPRECLPAEVDRLILRLLARDPQDRFADARELAAALDEILESRSPSAFAPRSTLPGSGPYRAPSMAAIASTTSTSSGGSMQMFAADDGEVTSVDAVPLFDLQWEPGMDRTGERLARTPHLDTPPPPPGFKPARGSTVSVLPVEAEKMIVRPPAPRSRFASLRLTAWVMTLLAGGIGLGMLVASLA
jgi:eukaryotic-like serine/threonine-protein kinase